MKIFFSYNPFNYVVACHKAVLTRIKGPKYYEPSVLSINLKTHNTYRLNSKVHKNNFCVENTFFPRFSILSHDLTCLLCLSVAHVRITKLAMIIFKVFLVLISLETTILFFWIFALYILLKLHNVSLI